MRGLECDTQQYFGSVRDVYLVGGGTEIFTCSASAINGQRALTQIARIIDFVSYIIISTPIFVDLHEALVLVDGKSAPAASLGWRVRASWPMMRELLGMM